jgi:hypothetical protein
VAASKTEAPQDASTPEGSTLSKEAAEFRAAQEKEWTQFVATAQIFHDGVLAYDVGHAVPASNVSTYGYDTQGLVEKRKG